MGRTAGPFLENTVFHTGKNHLSNDVQNGEFSADSCHNFWFGQ